jgi:hypothetical protein
MARRSTPCVDWIAAQVLDGSMNCDEFNRNFYDHGHKYLYTIYEVKQMLSRRGFESIVTSDYQSKDSLLGQLDSHADRYGHSVEQSMYIEAVKR